MYDGIGQALQDANADDSTNVIVLTGSGKFFCSGNDLGNFANVTDIKVLVPCAYRKRKINCFIFLF
jgi:enoyl-CoA hydratase/carnithine racemase